MRLSRGSASGFAVWVPISGFRFAVSGRNWILISDFWFPAEIGFRFPVSGGNWIPISDFRRKSEIGNWIPISGFRRKLDSDFRFPISGFRRKSEIARNLNLRGAVPGPGMTRPRGDSAQVDSVQGRLGPGRLGPATRPSDSALGRLGPGATRSAQVGPMRFQVDKRDVFFSSFFFFSKNPHTANGIVRCTKRPSAAGVD